MTIVEFYDGVSIHNMVSCLAMKPDKIIFIGERKLMLADEEAYTRFVRRKGIHVKFEFRSIHRNSIEQIISVLEDIVEEEASCVFDLTGGDDLVLVAMGMVYERHKHTEKVRMHRFNIRSGMATDCDRDGIVPTIEMPRMTVQDNITLYGGSLIPRDGEEGTYHWDFNDEFQQDLLDMWKICRRNPGLWNSQVTAIAQTTKKPTGPIVQALCDKGLVKFENKGDKGLSVSFKNHQIRECLAKAGNVLELIVTYYGRMAKDNNGIAVYDDVVTGAFIDWDARVHGMYEREKDTTNEIDVVLMKGLIPIFVSCKNGHVDQSELYKLHTVAEHFGGPYAKKVLICTYFGKESGAGHGYFLQRAKDMDIRVIENVHELSGEDLMAKIMNL